MYGRPFVLTIGLTLAAAQPGSNARAADLADLIPSLYGGDGITLAAPPPGIPSHEAHFEIDGQASINAFNEAIASEVRPFPVTPSAGGITYEFDPERGSYMQTADSLGPIVAERPQTLGKGKFSLGFGFSFFEYDRFEGDDLDNLRAVAFHDFFIIPPDDVPDSFENDVIDIMFGVDLKFQALAFSGTYGVTDRLDVGVVIPIVHAKMDVEASADIFVSPDNPFPSAHQFDQAECENTLVPDEDGLLQDDCISTASGSDTGIGDVILGAKYFWLDRERFDMAGALTIKLETGDEDNFLGTGSTTVRPFLIAAGELTDWATAHLNLGYEFDLSDSERNVVNYAAGVEVGDHKLTGVFDLLGRHETDSDGIGNDILDAAVGAKWSPHKNVILAANFLIPLNREQGLRSDLISTLAIEFRN